MADCPRCKRPSMDPSSPESFKVHALEVCMYRGGATCLAAESAYRRGLLAGVEVAKRHIAFDAYGDQCGYTEADSECFIWTYVDREAAKLAVEG